MGIIPMGPGIAKGPGRIPKISMPVQNTALMPMEDGVAKIPWLLKCRDGLIEFTIRFSVLDGGQFETYMTHLGFHLEKLESAQMATRYGGHMQFWRATIRDDKLFCMCCGESLTTEEFLGNQGYCLHCAAEDCLGNMNLQDFGRSQHAQYIQFDFMIRR